jgi:phage terminase small subunit
VLPLNELNEKQKIFVSEYLKDFNGTRAYKVAYEIENENVAAAGGSRLLRNVNIQQAIQAKANQHLDTIDVDTNYIISNIKEITERCMQKQPVMVFNPVDKCMEQKEVELFDEDGNPAGTAGVYTFNARDGLKGLELLGKYKNIFKENIDVNVNDSKKLKDVFSQMGGEGLDE